LPRPPPARPWQISSIVPWASVTSVDHPFSSCFSWLRLACGIGRSGLSQSHGDFAQGRNILLGDDHVFSNARHSARRFLGRHRRPRLRGWRPGLRRSSADRGGLYFYTNVSRTILFWTAFILTRPLGATIGDLLDKPVKNGGLALGRFEASAVLAVAMVVCLLLIPQRPGQHPGEYKGA
jgi:hypothetical protein